LGGHEVEASIMLSAGELSIGEVARRAGVRASALRFYERSGLIRRPRRASGRRVYDASVFESLALIQLARDAGFTIRETKWLLDGFDRSTPASARWQSLARPKLVEIRARIERAERMRDLLERLSRCRCETLGDCVRKRVIGLARGPVSVAH
jgi:MerR family transcriptional regulator, redox-sensitive transcriptional activator SoxR